jgi:hypothetical protein
MNKVPYGKPTASKRIPATVGPTNAPRAKTDVQRPEMRPYVSMVSGNPCWVGIQKPVVTYYVVSYYREALDPGPNPTTSEFITTSPTL